jgi:excinuclease ABC subunit C
VHRAAIARLPTGPGVYRFRDARSRVLYIGRAAGLRQRVGSYWADLGDRRHLARMVPQIARIEAVACDSVHEAAWLERNLLERSKPRWNRTSGVESAMCIRLSGTRLTAVHWPLPATDDSAGLYGPYLGGNQARLAVSALDRVLPLRYTDGRLLGTERDLARVRGVEPGHRDALLASVTAALRGDPAALTAVRHDLVRHRDRAAQRHAFELAARIQQEIEAVEWVAAEQKVTRMPASGTAEVFGWADGILLAFTIRNSRLDEWRLRATSREAAQKYLARTPDGWHAFAARNAELAGRLTTAY